MTLSKWLPALIRRVTGRSVRIHPSVSGTALLYYLVSQQIACIRAIVAQVLALRRPRLAFFGTGARVRGLGKMRFGKRMRIGRDSHVICWNGDGITLGNEVSLGERCVLMNGFNPFSPIGTITLGNNVGIGGYSYICAAAPVEIGADTIVGQYLSIHPQNHVYEDRNTLIRLQGVRSVGVRVGRNCWLGSKVTILDGVTIGDGCIVAAGAVVTKSFDAGTIIGGVPAKILGHR
jgi:acetyltransferase-like isoleucine patch superfamily enzyme